MLLSQKFLADVNKTRNSKTVQADDQLMKTRMKKEKDWKEERKKSLLEKYPLPAELACNLDPIHFEWASKAIWKGVFQEQILKKASELEENL